METQVANHRSATQAPARVSPAEEQRRARAPRVDIFDNDAEIVVLADVPGVTPEGVRLDMDRGELRLRAEVPADCALGAVAYARTFLVPRGVKTDDIRAELKNGVLRIVLPKSAELRRRQVEVKAG